MCSKKYFKNVAVFKFYCEILVTSLRKWSTRLALLIIFAIHEYINNDINTHIYTAITTFADTI